MIYWRTRSLTSNDKKRNEYIDFIKGLAIILMIIGHCVQYGYGAEYYMSDIYYEHNLVFKIIYSFHMPLFALISGYLLNGNSLRNSSIGEFIKNKIFTLIVPVFAWCITNELRSSLSKYILNGTSIDWLHIFIVGFTGIWYLWATFYGTIVVGISSKVLKKYAWIIIVFIMVAMFFLPEGYNSNEYVYLLPFIGIGYLYKSLVASGKYNLKFEENKIIIFIVSFIVWIILMFFFNKDSYIYFSGYSAYGKVVANQAYIDIYRIVIGLTGSVMFLLGTQILLGFKQDIKFKMIICRLGKDSMGIYIINSFLNRPLNTIITKWGTENPLIIVLEVIIMLAICEAGTNIIKKIKILNRLLLGGR